ncbi:hypothetical protein ASPCAL01330 [Aspergillus calidoustus]|uniref:Uncharacterized protein n=1 Tax=Aspergillus calidoustus TaxID=454130 RepID=A0A0U5FSY3_ASPCI|nr:hypothetical protein ASPCAL01330 [Aspergillus calidoustus]
MSYLSKREAGKSCHSHGNKLAIPDLSAYSSPVLKPAAEESSDTTTTSELATESMSRNVYRTKTGSCRRTKFPVATPIAIPAVSHPSRPSTSFT